MRVKHAKQMVILVVIAVNLVVLGGCGSSNNSQSSDYLSSTEAVYDTNLDDSYDTAMEETSEISVEDSSAGSTTENFSIKSTQEGESSSSQVSGQKLIKDVNMSVETTDFDAFITELNNHINSLGGYVENSDVSGGSYQYDNYRYGNIVARIPADQLEGFVKTVKEEGNVVHTSEQTTDVTLQYVDIESHLKALKVEQETLMDLLENATSMEDVIAIQSQLTQVRYEIESNESQIRTYDNLVNYSTVTIDITEVERETKVVEETSPTEEIKVKLANNLYAIREGFISFLINFIAYLPYIIIWAVVIIVIIIISKKIVKRRKNTKIGGNNSKNEESKKQQDIDKENE